MNQKIIYIYFFYICLGTGEEELRAAWERLGVGTDGFLHRNELAMVCSAVGMDTLADQVCFILH